VARAFASSYLAGEAAARAFIPLDFRDPETRARRTRAAAERRVSPDLLAVLGEQQARLPPSAARGAHLDALRAGGTAVVATGQQVGLFLGPLYGFYKAASAVAVARALAAEAGVRCVPLFWLQTEDHDFEEIAAANVLGRAGTAVRLVLGPAASGEARVSIAHRRLGPEVDGLLDALADALPSGPASDDAVALLRAHYAGGRPLGGAFAGALGALFADEGLLVFDPREARVAALAAPVYRRAIADARALETGLEARRQALEAAGFDEQIAAREGCALLFLHRGGATGARHRLLRVDGAPAGWALSGCDETISDVALAAALEREPLRFSTSALLRPIVQDALWPTAAYVGGPAELNYFAQLGPVYERFGMSAPLVVPRARFRCADARTRRLLRELGLAADDLARPRDELLARLGAVRAPVDAPGPEALRARVASEIAPPVDEIARAVAGALPHLERAAERTRASVAHVLRRLTERYARALGERDAVAVERLARAQAALAPGGVPQERAYAWPSLAGRVGPAALKQMVMASLAADPFGVALRELAP
jgi:bacillithiol biosynthesis cysteine-adding enzyme BshC